jgi:hypothetical protein
MISPPPIENSSDHEQAEALDLIDGNGRRHGEFLPAHDGFNQSRPVMTERLLDHRSDLIRRFGSEPKDAGTSASTRPTSSAIASRSAPARLQGRLDPRFAEKPALPSTLRTPRRRGGAGVAIAHFRAGLNAGSPVAYC